MTPQRLLDPSDQHPTFGALSALTLYVKKPLSVVRDTRRRLREGQRYQERNGQ